MRIQHFGFGLLFIAATVGCFGAIAQPKRTSSPRPIENWPYAKLFANSETVVIARPISNADTAARTKENLWKIEYQGVNTTFEVISTLKGAATPRIVVSHFKLPPGISVDDGPLQSKFRTGRVELETEEVKMSLPAPHYMLFLKSNADRNFQLISGHTDSALAVREVFDGTPFSEFED